MATRNVYQGPRRSKAPRPANHEVMAALIAAGDRPETIRRDWHLLALALLAHTTRQQHAAGTLSDAEHRLAVRMVERLAAAGTPGHVPVWIDLDEEHERCPRANLWAVPGLIKAYNRGRKAFEAAIAAEKRAKANPKAA